MFFFFMTWFDVFMQLKYPILRIFGEEIEESFWLEGPDVYERYLPGRVEVRDFGFLTSLSPSLGSVIFDLFFLRRLFVPLLDMFFLRVLSKVAM